MKYEIPCVTYEPRSNFGDAVPVCGRDLEDLEAIGLDEYGDGLYCPECMYWWPGLDYFPSDFQCKACEGCKGRPMPYDIAIEMMRDFLEEES